jgi:signal transduction histidine kinase
MNVKRSMISLIDRKYQYILAESTRTLSLQCDDVHENGDGLWLGVQTIERGDGVCGYTITKQPKDPDAEDVPTVIDDMKSDEEWTGRPCLTQQPDTRFYAGVPIRTKTGSSIGTYCIMDDMPRTSGISSTELEFLRDMAKTVMEHLDYMAVKEDHQRAEKMVKGLGLFVEGRSSINDWWFRTRNGKDQRGRFGSIKHPESKYVGLEDYSMDPQYKSSGKDSPSQAEDSTNQPLDTKLAEASSSKETQQTETKSQLEGAQDIDSHYGGNKVSDPDQQSPRTKRENMISDPDQQPPRTGRESKSSDPENHSPRTGSPVAEGRQDSEMSREIRTMLARASNLIRESTAVDGVIFFDARASGFGAQVNSSSSLSGRRPTSCHDATTTSSSEEDFRKRPKNSASDRESKGIKEESKCEVLAYSTAQSSSLQGQAASQSHLAVSQAFVGKLLKRYPHGKIFSFDEDGAMSSSEEDLQRQAKKEGVALVAQENSGVNKRSAKANEGTTILKIFPGSRFIMLLPLWDSHRERWFASSMLWTSSQTRVLTIEDDMNYLAAFSNSIMAEVSRLDVIAADHAKTTFISSVSHELRSPLHGILGSVELLNDTSTTQFQAGIVETISQCSTTLLDTLTNVLDFAKINYFTRKRKERKSLERHRRSRKAMPAEGFSLYGTISLTSDIDLSAVTEEVIESVYAGHQYEFHSESAPNTKRLIQFKKTNSDDVGTYQHQTKSNIAIIVEIDHKSDWRFNTQPGAWRRIMMNIFGNAVKYTNQGYVKVHLECKDISASKFRLNQAIVTLTISDSGKGISPDFLKSQLYTPFAQEDSIAPGTGLGLSIVQQIVKALDGKVEVESKKGSGTVVKVQVKLDKSKMKDGDSSKPIDPENDLVQQARTQTSGRIMALIGFGTTSSSSAGKDTGKSDPLTPLRSSISKTAESWYDMKVVYASDFESVTADVFVSTESAAKEFSVISTACGDAVQSVPGGPPVIVLKDGLPSSRNFGTGKFEQVYQLGTP